MLGLIREKMETLLIIYGLSLIPSAIACHFIAKARGGNPVMWGMNGLFSVSQKIQKINIGPNSYNIGQQSINLHWC